MTDAQLQMLRITLLALLSKERGGKVGVAALAATAVCSPAEVTNALTHDAMRGDVGYDRNQDAYFYVKKGDAL